MSTHMLACRRSQSSGIKTHQFLFAYRLATDITVTQTCDLWREAFSLTTADRGLTPFQDISCRSAHVCWTDSPHMQVPRLTLHVLLTLMESTRSSTRNRRLTSAMVLLSLARTMSLYLWTMSSGRATSWSRYCLKDKDKIHSHPFWLTTYGHLGQHGKHWSHVCGSLTWTGALHQTSGWPAGCPCISWSWWWQTAGPGRCTRWRSQCCTPSGTAVAAERRQTPRLLSSHHASTQDPPLQVRKRRGLCQSLRWLERPSSTLIPHLTYQK